MQVSFCKVSSAVFLQAGSVSRALLLAGATGGLGAASQEVQEY